MNVYALTHLQQIVAKGVGERLGREVKIGRYVDISDSLHIYGSYFSEVRSEIEKMRDGDYSSRSWVTDHPAFQMLTEEAKEKAGTGSRLVCQRARIANSVQKATTVLPEITHLPGLI